MVSEFNWAMWSKPDASISPPQCPHFSSAGRNDASSLSSDFVLPHREHETRRTKCRAPIRRDGRLGFLTPKVVRPTSRAFAKVNLSPFSFWIFQTSWSKRHEGLRE